MCSPLKFDFYDHSANLNMKLYLTEIPTIVTNLNVILKRHVSVCFLLFTTANFSARDETLQIVSRNQDIL